MAESAKAQESRSETEPDAPAPPPYSSDASSLPQAEPTTSSAARPPPSPGAVVPSLQPPFVPHRAFPPLMTAYYIYEMSLETFKYFRLCGGTDKTDVLLTCEMCTGLVPRSPLGTRPGIILHNGPSKDAPVLAATGAESQRAAQYLSFNPRSVVLLPPLRAAPRATVRDLTTTTMRAVRVEENKGVGFQLSLAVGGPDARDRDEFEWRKGTWEGATPGRTDSGYTLLRLAPSGREHEVIATLKWPRGLEWLTKAFTLELKGSAHNGSLGDRGVLMIVATAMRIFNLRLAGQAGKGYLSIADKTHKKEARGQEW
ncbi:hypothetical protein B0T18DRAFT_416075 [Schizothecium vesticola]|uniref:Uncharacterized protein n=1 Tax=Schizothecium vesticola TaxID=314040 RepID=A0AA40K2U7_9PEZI|nr:hypothetical protein B0T18DRAFT_416075 [Schizothecium vesticola]